MLDQWVKEQMLVPGVGSYDPKPARAFGNEGITVPKEAARPGLVAKGVEFLPGPGTYDPPPGATADGGAAPRKEVGFSKEEQRPVTAEERETKAMPGPGAYCSGGAATTHHHAHFASAPMHAFPKDATSAFVADTCVPGPAHYDLHQDTRRGGGALGQSWAGSREGQGGRGAAGWFLGGVAMATFPKEAQRPAAFNEVQAAQNPGPSSYTLPGLLSTAGVSAFGKENRCPRPYVSARAYADGGEILNEGAAGAELLPGPGQYTPQFVKGFAGAGLVAFPKAERSDLSGKDELVPGPGAYTLRKDLTDEAVDALWARGQASSKRACIGNYLAPGAVPFGREGREDLSLQRHAESVPGVGAYDIGGASSLRGHVWHSAPAVSIPLEAQRPPDHTQRAAAEVPGVGRYSSAESASTLRMPSVQSVSMGSEQRGVEPAMRAALEVPGVGSYSPDTVSDIGSHVGWSRLPKGISMGTSERGGDPAEREQANVPGVGAYGGSVLEKDCRWGAAPRAVIGSEVQRPDDVVEKSRSSVPGVGAYSLPEVSAYKDKAPAAVIGSEVQRPPDTTEAARAAVPGVGAYDTPASTGAIQPPDAPGWQGITIGQKLEVGGVMEGAGFPNAGPGAYDVSGVTRNSKPASRAVSFSQAERTDRSLGPDINDRPGKCPPPSNAYMEHLQSIVSPMKSIHPAAPSSAKPSRNQVPGPMILYPR